MNNDFDLGYQAGLLASIDLLRAGCDADDLARILPSDPRDADPAAYELWLAELRQTVSRPEWADALLRRHVSRVSDDGRR